MRPPPRQSDNGKLDRPCGLRNRCHTVSVAGGDGSRTPTTKHESHGAPRRGPGRPVDRDNAKTRLQILEVAVEVFAEHGFAAGKIRTIADGAGLSHGTVQHHFRSKRDLFYAAYEHAAELLVDGYDAVLVDCQSLTEELDAVLQRSARFMTEQPWLTGLLIRAASERTHTQLHPLRFTRRLDEFIDGIAQRAIERRELTPNEGNEFHYVMQALLWGLSIVGISNETARRASIHGFQRLLTGQLRLGDPTPTDGAAPSAPPPSRSR